MDTDPGGSHRQLRMAAYDGPNQRKHHAMSPTVILLSCGVLVVVVMLVLAVRENRKKSDS